MARRSTKYTLSITRRIRLECKLRNFRTSKERRSKKFTQLVFNTPIRNLREIEIRYISNHGVKGKKPAVTIAQTLNKHSYSLSGLGIVIAGFSGIVFFSQNLETKINQAPTPIVKSLTTPADSSLTKPTLPNNKEEIGPSKPTRITIPNTNIDSAIKPVGLLADGSIETPGLNEEVVGWYKLGKSPGEKGTAVIVGHIDTYKGPSVFYQLFLLTPGMEIHIEREDKKELTFIVSEVTEYRQADFPAEKIYSNTENASLRLITCSGTYNHSTGRYSHNLVVFADIK